MARKSQSTVTLNSKPSAVNIMMIREDGAVAAGFAEGAPVMINATTGAAATASGQSPAVLLPKALFINYVDSDRSDVSFIQEDRLDPTAPSIHIEGGGLACIVGNTVDIGLAASSWSSGALPTIGHYVTVNAAGTMWTAESPTPGDTYYGVVYRHYNGRAHFLFNSMPSVVQ